MRPRPKFCVGEEVKIVGCVDPANNCEKIEITKVQWVDEWNEEGKITPSWGYTTVIMEQDSDCLHPETQLRKLPPEERVSWEDCAWSPLKIKDKYKL